MKYLVALALVAGLAGPAHAFGGREYSDAEILSLRAQRETEALREEIWRQSIETERQFDALRRQQFDIEQRQRSFGSDDSLWMRR